MGLDKTNARLALKGFVTDILTGNWDAVGASLDNMMVTEGGKIVRIDNGGTFLMRAKAGRKPVEALNAITEWELFFSPYKNPSYAKLVEAAGYAGPNDFREEIIKQFADVLETRDLSGGWDKYVDFHAPLLKGEDRQRVISMLDSRTKLLESKVAGIEGVQAAPLRFRALPRFESADGCLPVRGSRRPISRISRFETSSIFPRETFPSASTRLRTAPRSRSTRRPRSSPKSGYSPRRSAR